MAAVAGPLFGRLAHEGPAVEGLGDGRVLALAVDLLFQLGVLAQGLGVLLLPGLALLGQGLLDLPLLRQGPQPLGLLGFQGRLLNFAGTRRAASPATAAADTPRPTEGSSAGRRQLPAAPRGGRAKSGCDPAAMEG